ncbi:MAG: hypothetical protein JEZ02_05715 [Desulfatibacillum sp.]|nr:hypothetical protein [Desulfatibacillum sp.]
MRFVRSALVLAVIVLLTYGCGPKSVSPVQFGSPAASDRVLIATEDSEFKNAILDDVVEAFFGQDVFIQVTDLQSLENIRPEDYRAIVLINTCIAWKVEPEIAAFLKKVNEPERVLVLTTTGDPDLTILAPDVDSVTSASQMEKVDQVSRKIIDKVARVLAMK